MKTVNDIILSDLIDDDTVVDIVDSNLNRLSSPYINCRRFYEDIERWGEYEVYEMVYFPGSNILGLYLNYYAAEEEIYK